jgi:hypothetical protein
MLVGAEHAYQSGSEHGLQDARNRLRRGCLIMIGLELHPSAWNRENTWYGGILKAVGWLLRHLEAEEENLREVRRELLRPLFGARAGENFVTMTLELKISTRDLAV